MEKGRTSKNIIITGASKGIGFATALEFARRGHHVMAIARNADNLERLEKAGKSLSGHIYIKVCNIMDFKVEMLPESFSTIDILINNAGSLINKPFMEINKGELEHIYTTNVFAPFLLTQRLFPLFDDNAHIINIGSVGGVNGTQKFPGLSAYSSSKAASSCLSECWQAEFAETNLTFNSLALGSVQTEMLEAAFPGYNAVTTPEKMANYITDFALNGHIVVKGKTQLVSSSNP